MAERTPLLRWLCAVVVIACATLLAVTVVLFRAPALRRAAGLSRSSRASYTVGDHLSNLPASDPSSVPLNTVVLFARSTCGASRREESALTAVVAVARGHARVLLATANPAAPAERAFAKRLGLGPDDMIQYGTEASRLQHVPAVVVATDRGAVTFAWEAPQIADGLVEAVRAHLR